MTDPNAVRAELRQKAFEHARRYLFDFTQMVFPEVEPAGSFIEARHSMLLAHTFGKVASGEIKRLLVAIPPRFGKSLIGSVTFPTWMLGHDPSLKIICASYGDELSRDFALQSRNVMQSQRYRELFPKTVLAPDGTALQRLATTRGGYRRSTSVDGALTGKGADIVIVDDPLKAKDAVHSQAARDEAFNWITGTLMSRFDRPADGRLVVLSQRLHTDDLIARLRDEGGWELLCVPAEALRPMSLDIGEAKPWTLGPGDLLFPERFDHAALAQLRSDLGEANYAAQILQDPQALGGAIFKVKDFDLQDCSTFKADKVEAVYQSWDTAISEEETAAYSVCTTWGVYGKYFALLDVFRERLAFPDLLKAVHAQYQKHRPRCVIVENASSGTALIQQLRQERNNWIWGITPRGSKLERAMHQAPKVEAGRVIIPRRAPWADTFLAEIAAFPNGRSDQVDSMTQFLKTFDTAKDHVLFRELKYWRNMRNEP